MNGTVLERWQTEWPEALAVWSKFTRLREPAWLANRKLARQEGLTGSFACIRLTDRAGRPLKFTQ